MAIYRLVLGLLLISYHHSVSAADLELKSSANKTYQLFVKDGVRVSESCLKASCQALVPVKNSVLGKASSKYLDHPAASLCQSQKGKYEIARHTNGDEDGLCVFSDKSYVLAWDYYKRNTQKAKSKEQKK